MNILLANSTAYPNLGGVETSLRYIGRELLQAGHEVKVFCFSFLPDEPLQIEHEGIEIIRHPCKNERWPHRQYLSRVAAAQRGIGMVLEEFKPNVIWCRAASMGLGIRRGGYAGPMLQIFPTNAKMNCRATFLQSQGLPARRRLMLLGLWPSAYLTSASLERELLRQCVPVTFSENMRQQLLMGIPKGAKVCHVIPPGVDGALFSPDNGARFFKTIEDKYGISRDEPIILYVGRLSSAKNIPLLMDAATAVKNHAKLVLVGSGPEEDRLKSYAHNIGLAERVVFVGAHRKMLPGFYAMSRVCVLPTTIESFGQTYLESLACGTPVVGFAGDGNGVLTATAEIIRDGLTGAIVYEVSSLALAKKIDSIISLDNAMYSEMAQRARKDVIDRFSWPRFVADALKLTDLQKQS